MYSLDVPAGWRIRLIATASPGAKVHRWGLGLVAEGDPTQRIGAEYGSVIGDGDVHQGIDIPAQELDCTVEISSRHVTKGGWEEDRLTVEDDTPDSLTVSFCSPTAAGAPQDDIRLTFAFAYTR